MWNIIWFIFMLLMGITQFILVFATGQCSVLLALITCDILIAEAIDKLGDKK